MAYILTLVMTGIFPYDNLYNETTVNKWKMYVKLANFCDQLNINNFYTPWRLYARNKVTFCGYFEKDEQKFGLLVF
jgi:hypothetical protein